MDRQPVRLDDLAAFLRAQHGRPSGHIVVALMDVYDAALAWEEYTPASPEPADVVHGRLREALALFERIPRSGE